MLYQAPEGPSCFKFRPTVLFSQDMTRNRKDILEDVPSEVRSAASEAISHTHSVSQVPFLSNCSPHHHASTPSSPNLRLLQQRSIGPS